MPTIPPTPDGAFPRLPRCEIHDRLLDLIDGDVEPCDLCESDLLDENEAS